MIKCLHLYYQIYKLGGKIMDKNEFIEKEKMAFSNQVDSECVA